MLRINSCTPNTLSYEKTQEERLEREALREEKKLMTRKEKKAKYGWRSFFAKAEKFDVPIKDKMISRRRKSHKHNTTKTKHKKDTKSFSKFEGIFKRWLENNIERFNHRPIAQAGGKYIFEGIIKNIKYGISDYEMYLSYEYEGGTACDENETYFDTYYIEYIGAEKYHPQKGFYDGDRVDGVYTYFPTREELYINEVFEYAISSCNEKLIQENSLYLYDSGSTSGLIDASDESNKNNYIEDLSQEECHKLLLEDKAYKTIKFDLFDSSKEPLIRYTKIS